jgi:hypothetical protein
MSQGISEAECHHHIGTQAGKILRGDKVSRSAGPTPDSSRSGRRITSVLGAPFLARSEIRLVRRRDCALLSGCRFAEVFGADKLRP